MRLINGISVLDTLDELVDPRHTAVVCVDMQNDFCHPRGHFARYGKDISDVEALVPRVVAFVAEAQRLGLPCVFLQQYTLPGGAGDSPAWLRFKCRDGKAADYTLQGSWGWQLVDGLVPAAQDLVVPKPRPDGFHATPLDWLLRARRFESLVVFGTTTEGCVESTIRSASYRDYYVVVGRDLVASPNRLQHAGSLNLYQQRYPLADAADMLAVWRRAASPAAPALADAAG